MKIYIERIFFYNRAPFDKLDLKLQENGITILSAINGRGKTTILSYIADAFFELARSAFSNEFRGKDDLYFS